MIKIAFFVEGQTERIFLENLLDNYFTHPNFNIESQEVRGGRTKIVTHVNYCDLSIRYYFLIIDVGGDSKVVSEIFERAEDLIKKHNYNHIFGIRDLYPHKHEQLKQVKNSLLNIFQDDSIIQDISLIVAVMEVETWFLANHSFFQRIEGGLTTECINTTLKIDIEKDDLESYRHPAKMIDDILRLVNKSYTKRESDTYGICSKLDYEELCLNEKVRSRIRAFDEFLLELDKFYN